MSKAKSLNTSRKPFYFRNKSGLWGWRTDRAEIVNGRNCKVFGASNVELVTKSRTEHLSEAEKSRLLASQSNAAARFPLNSLLAGTQIEEPALADQEVGFIFRGSFLINF